VAFKDQDGSAHCSLLSNKQLFILGARAKVSFLLKGQQGQPPYNSNSSTAISSPSTLPHHGTKEDDIKSSTLVAHKMRSKRQSKTAAKMTFPFPKLA
jgi:hypothetical protein